MCVMMLLPSILQIGISATQNGVLLTEQDTTHRLCTSVEVLKQTCLNGKFDCANPGNNAWIYTLKLGENAMKGACL